LHVRTTHDVTDPLLLGSKYSAGFVRARGFCGFMSGPQDISRASVCLLMKNGGPRDRSCPSASGHARESELVNAQDFPRTYGRDLDQGPGLTLCQINTIPKRRPQSRRLVSDGAWGDHTHSHKVHAAGEGKGCGGFDGGCGKGGGLDWPEADRHATCSETRSK